LLAEGYAVQLSHEETETTFENHGFVRVIASNGDMLAEDDKFQHNREMRCRKDRLAALVASVETELKKMQAPSKVEPPSESEESTAPSSEEKS
jgi:hypothetical protein